MKKTIYHISIILTGLAFVFSSCSKDDEVAAAKKCSLSSIKIAGDTLYSTHEYNGDNRIVKTQYYKDKDVKSMVVTYTYSKDKIVQYYKEDDYEGTSTFTLGSNGYAAYVTGVEDTTFYSYDNDGYLIKQEQKRYYMTDGVWYQTTAYIESYTIVNGNKTKSVRTNGAGELVTTYEYYDKANPGVFEAFDYLGKHNKNLVKSEKSTDGYDRSYTYDFGSNGLPSKVSITRSGGGSEYFLNYQCK